MPTPSRVSADLSGLLATREANLAAAASHDNEPLVAALLGPATPLGEESTS
jgi:hypothetical protein